MTNNLSSIQNKIVPLTELKGRCQQWRETGEKVVFTNGCFDILHKGHIDYLSKAADLGSKLIVGVNSDDSVRQLGKGSARPLQDESSRSLILAALEFVDAVVLFHEDTPLVLIEALVPDILVKGGDYKIEEIVGHEIVLERGGEVRRLDFLPGYSTTAIENKIKETERPN